MLMALRLGSVLSLAGQASTHRPQPVQSSGALWMVATMPVNSLPAGLGRLEGLGAPSRTPAS